jgi:hypothetical protein
MLVTNWTTFWCHLMTSSTETPLFRPFGRKLLSPNAIIIFFGLIPIPVIFFGLIPVPVIFFGLVTGFFWSYSSTCNIFWSCYCPPHFFWSYSSTSFGLITVLIFGPKTVLRFWSYYGDPIGCLGYHNEKYQYQNNLYHVS